MNRELLRRQLDQLPLLQYEFFDTRDLEFSDRIRYVCQTQCPMYATSWACPPAVGTVAECKARCLQYPEGLMIATIQEAEIMDMEAALATRAPHETITREVAQLVRAQGTRTLVLSTEACAFCAKCTYPDAPCRHPERMFPCVESHGIVASALAERYGVEFYAGPNLVTWFSLILFKEGAAKPAD